MWTLGREGKIVGPRITVIGLSLRFQVKENIKITLSREHWFFIGADSEQGGLSHCDIFSVNRVVFLLLGVQHILKTLRMQLSFYMIKYVIDYHKMSKLLFQYL